MFHVIEKELLIFREASSELSPGLRQEAAWALTQLHGASRWSRVPDPQVGVCSVDNLFSGTVISPTDSGEATEGPPCVESSTTPRPMPRLACVIPTNCVFTTTEISSLQVWGPEV